MRPRTFHLQQADLGAVAMLQVNRLDRLAEATRDQGQGEMTKAAGEGAKELETGTETERGADDRERQTGAIRTLYDARTCLNMQDRSNCCSVQIIHTQKRCMPEFH